MDVAGKAAIVTGGATGIGRATAIELARRGCSVLVAYRRSQSESEATVEELRAMGVGAGAYQLDVADDVACRQMAAAAVRQFGRVDVLVQSAGTTIFVDARELERLGDDDWDRIFAVNVRGAFQCARAVRRLMEQAGGGSIVNVSSLAGSRAFGSSIPYSTSKAALNSLTTILAQVLAPAIRVNAVAPGFVSGRWLQRGLGPAYDPLKARVEARTPLQSVCEPADVAAAIVGLICGSDMVTGHILTVDGGISIGL